MKCTLQDELNNHPATVGYYYYFIIVVVQIIFPFSVVILSLYKRSPNHSSQLQPSLYPPRTHFYKSLIVRDYLQNDYHKFLIILTQYFITFHFCNINNSIIFPPHLIAPPCLTSNAFIHISNNHILLSPSHKYQQAVLKSHSIVIFDSIRFNNFQKPQNISIGTKICFFFSVYV